EIMEKAIKAYNTITVSPEFKELERLRSIARHNEAATLRFEREQAKEEERIEIAKNLLQKGMSADFIHETTGLSKTEVETLLMQLKA
ncbi:MAG: hypothetical protein FWB86_10150, partial [Treponema sp.]|nr:hypothetical protein [Treponema sp.]